MGAEIHACTLGSPHHRKLLRRIPFLCAELSTSLDSSTEDGRQKPKMEVLLGKAPNFDAVVERQAKEQAAAKGAAAGES